MESLISFNFLVVKSQCNVKAPIDVYRSINSSHVSQSRTPSCSSSSESESSAFTLFRFLDEATERGSHRPVS